MTKDEYIAECVIEGARLKEILDETQTKLRAINRELEKSLEFGDKNTAKAVADGIEVKVVRRENVKWDQNRLHNFRSVVGDDVFFSLFKIEFKPDNGHVKKYLETGEHAKGIEWCREVSPGAPAVTYTFLEEV